MGLGVFALVLLWQVPEPTVVPIPTLDDVDRSTEAPVLLLSLYVLLDALAGAAFALIARPSWTDWTFRWRTPLIVASIPAAIIALQLLVFAGAVRYTTAGVSGAVISFVVSNFSLRVPAILLGVALAQGVVSDPLVEDQPGLGETRPTDAANQEYSPG